MKTALVLSGGGAKGAFQFAAEKYAREKHGYHWDIVAGVSIGALNGMMIAMEKYERLEKLWHTLSDKVPYREKVSWFDMIKLLFGARSINNQKFIMELIENEFEHDKIKTGLRVGAVSLMSGEYKFFSHNDPDFKKGVLASTAIPVFWPPVDVGKYKSMVDGGVRTISPLGDVLDTNPREVVIINCSPNEPDPAGDLSRAIDIGLRTIDIMTNEIFLNDIREFIRINKNVKEAARKGIKLHNDQGKTYKFFKSKIIQPETPLGDTFDFSTESIQRSIQLGYDAAKRVLG